MALYYVKNGGNDGLDGLSDANAWATIGKVNGASFAAGDSVLFKRGSVFRDAALAFPSSGSSGSPITIGAYGTGTKPIISGSDLKNTAGDWTDEGGNLWYLSSIVADPRCSPTTGRWGRVRF